MKHFIATFYSHFGAIRFKRELGRVGIQGTIQPVPRSLSSSCGTCVMFAGETYEILHNDDEIEQIVEVTPGGYRPVYQADN